MYLSDIVALAPSLTDAGNTDTALLVILKVVEYEPFLRSFAILLERRSVVYVIRRLLSIQYV